MPPRLTARSTESIVCMNGIGPVEVVLLERMGEPCERSLVTERPMPPVPLVSHMTSRTLLAMCSMSSCISMTKQFDSCG